MSKFFRKMKRAGRRLGKSEKKARRMLSKTGAKVKRVAAKADKKLATVEKVARKTKNTLKNPALQAIVAGVGGPEGSMALNQAANIAGGVQGGAKTVRVLTKRK